MVNKFIGLNEHKTIQLFAAGGGSPEDSRLFDEFFVKSIDTCKKMIYIPIAMDEKRHPYASCYKWIKSVFKPLGLEKIEMWTQLSDSKALSTCDYSSVYIGGGNTYKLLYEIRRRGFDRVLNKFIENGGVVYGGSAGAIILGKDITTCAHADENTVGIQNFSGLNVFNGYSLWCHFRPEEESLINNYLNKYHVPVIAIPEKSGLYLRSIPVIKKTEL